MLEDVDVVDPDAFEHLGLRVRRRRRVAVDADHDRVRDVGPERGIGDADVACIAPDVPAMVVQRNAVVRGADEAVGNLHALAGEVAQAVGPLAGADRTDAAFLDVLRVGAHHGAVRLVEEDRAIDEDVLRVPDFQLVHAVEQSIADDLNVFYAVNNEGAFQHGRAIDVDRAVRAQAEFAAVDAGSEIDHRGGEVRRLALRDLVGCQVRTSGRHVLANGVRENVQIV